MVEYAGVASGSAGGVGSLSGTGSLGPYLPYLGGAVVGLFLVWFFFLRR